MSGALLALEDGTVFRGVAAGAPGTALGEVVFNTGMTGYEEVLTDPSYRGQIVAMTAAHVGNYGMNPDHAESDRMQVAGFVVREMSHRPSSWTSTGSLPDALRAAGVVAIEGVDTRRLTRHLRALGAMRAAVSTEVLDADALVAVAAAGPSMVGRELASEVGVRDPLVLRPSGEVRFRVAALDLGIKRSMVRFLLDVGAEVHLLPGSTSADDVLALAPDGLFVSNGPGDPATVGPAVATMRALLGEVPVFGICLGSQLLGRALGARTYKLAFGHRGVNQPVLRRSDGVVEITSHNHGFAVDPTTLGERLEAHAYATADHGAVEVSHVNLNDDVCEGLVARDLPAFSVQYHPEAAPGPSDARYLFGRFAALMEGVRSGRVRSVAELDATGASGALGGPAGGPGGGR
jgi:carbamoyl-phosphate synthase small subunit